jgi:hypothetical protein
LENSAKGTAPALDEVKAPEPGNWSAVPESSWEAEAKRASMLASTWDVAPAPVPATEETQDVSAYAAESSEIHVEHPESLPENQVSAYSGHWEGGHETAAPAEASTQEAVTEAPADVCLPKSWENTWELPSTPAVPPVVKEAHPQAEPEVQHVPEPAPVHVEAAHVTEAAPEPRPVPETVAQPVQPNMDELVARVLGKINPEVLQKVTQEILKPVIEALVRDELNSKKL